MDPVTFDALDRRLVHALQVDGRVPFARLADVLGTSERTLTRRYRRLRTAGVLRVVGVPSAGALGREEWLVRMRCLPHAASGVASVLAARADTSWVTIVSGGAEITCLTRAPAGTLVLGSLPRSSRIGEVTAQRLLRAVAGTGGWPVRVAALTPEQVHALRDPAPDGPDPGPAVLDGGDRALLPVLARDGRASWAALASATGWSAASAARRVTRLRRSGAIRLEVDVDPGLFGFGQESLLWLTVRPPALAALGRALDGYPQVAFAAVTTGRTNVVAIVLCSGDDELYDDVLLPLGRLDGVEHVDVAPVARQVSRSVPLPFEDHADKFDFTQVRTTDK